MESVGSSDGMRTAVSVVHPPVSTQDPCLFSPFLVLVLSPLGLLLIIVIICRRSVSSVTVHPCGKVALSVSPQDSSLRLWDLVHGRCALTSPLKGRLMIMLKIR